jgi:hypothetical protein
MNPLEERFALAYLLTGKPPVTVDHEKRDANAILREQLLRIAARGEPNGEKKEEEKEEPKKRRVRPLDHDRIRRIQPPLRLMRESWSEFLKRALGAAAWQGSSGQRPAREGDALGRGRRREGLPLVRERRFIRRWRRFAAQIGRRRRGVFFRAPAGVARDLVVEGGDLRDQRPRILARQRLGHGAKRLGALMPGGGENGVACWVRRRLLQRLRRDARCRRGLIDDRSRLGKARARLFLLDQRGFDGFPEGHRRTSPS